MNFHVDDFDITYYPSPVEFPDYKNFIEIGLQYGVVKWSYINLFIENLMIFPDP